MSPHQFVQAFRLQNFMGFEDTGWIEFRPVTLLFGRNSTGKSALMRALLLLRQSVLFPAENEPLSYVVTGEFDFGGFPTLVRNHEIAEPIVVWFRCSIPQAPPAESEVNAAPAEYTRSGDLLGRWIEGAEFAGATLRYISVRLRLEFRLLVSDHRTNLYSVDLLDPAGDVIFRATAPENSAEDVPWRIDSQFFDQESPPQYSGLEPGELPNVWEAIKVFTNDGFLPRLRVFDEVIEKETEDESVFGDDFQTVNTVLRRLQTEITAFLEGLGYLGPIRAAPQRFYYLAGRNVGGDSAGNETVRRLLHARRQKPTRYRHIVNWMRESTLKVEPKLGIIDEDKELYELVFSESDNNYEITMNVSEVGSGLSQVLPVVVEASLASEDSVLLLEQPELHLHPRAQAELGDLFISVTKQGTLYFVETHSEHLLLRLRRRIAETTVGQSSDNFQLQFSSDDLRAYFVDRSDGKSTVEEIQITSLGKMKGPQGFRRFFADDLQELALLNQAILAAYEQEDSEAYR